MHHEDADDDDVDDHGHGDEGKRCTKSLVCFSNIIIILVVITIIIIIISTLFIIIVAMAITAKVHEALMAYLQQRGVYCSATRRGSKWRAWLRDWGYPEELPRRITVHANS